jgi:hypothetical protein
MGNGNGNQAAVLPSAQLLLISEFIEWAKKDDPDPVFINILILFNVY